MTGRELAFALVGGLVAILIQQLGKLLHGD